MSDKNEALCRTGTVVNKAYWKGRTQLSIAIEKGEKEMVEILIRSGADVNKADENGRTPLIIAILEGQKETVEVLIRSGADVNKADKEGRTPLIIAIEEGQKEIVEILIRSGADDSKPEMVISVQTPSGRQARLKVESSDTVESIIARAAKREGPAPDGVFQLMFCGFRLENQWTLGSCGITSGATLLLSVVKRGSGSFDGTKSERVAEQTEVTRVVLNFLQRFGNQKNEAHCCLVLIFENLDARGVAQCALHPSQAQQRPFPSAEPLAASAWRNVVKMLLSTGLSVVHGCLREAGATSYFEFFDRLHQHAHSLPSGCAITAAMLLERHTHFAKELITGLAGSFAAIASASVPVPGEALCCAEVLSALARAKTPGDGVPLEASSCRHEHQLPPASSMPPPPLSLVSRALLESLDGTEPQWVASLFESSRLRDAARVPAPHRDDFLRKVLPIVVSRFHSMLHQLSRGGVLKLGDFLQQSASGPAPTPVPESARRLPLTDTATSSTYEGVFVSEALRMPIRELVKRGEHITIELETSTPWMTAPMAGVEVAAAAARVHPREDLLQARQRVDKTLRDINEKFCPPAQLSSCEHPLILSLRGVSEFLPAHSVAQERTATSTSPPTPSASAGNDIEKTRALALAPLSSGYVLVPADYKYRGIPILRGPITVVLDPMLELSQVAGSLITDKSKFEDSGDRNPTTAVSELLRTRFPQLSPTPIVRQAEAAASANTIEFQIESRPGDARAFSGTAWPFWIQRPENRQISSLGWIIDMRVQGEDCTRSIVLNAPNSAGPGARPSVLKHRSISRRLQVIAAEMEAPAKPKALVRLRHDARAEHLAGRKIGLFSRFSFTVDQWLAADADVKMQAEVRGRRVTARFDRGSPVAPLERDRSLISHLQEGRWTDEQLLTNAFVEANLFLDFIDTQVTAIGEFKLEVVVSQRQHSRSDPHKGNVSTVIIGNDGTLAHCALDRQTIIHEIMHGLVECLYKDRDSEIQECLNSQALEEGLADFTACMADGCDVFAHASGTPRSHAYDDEHPWSLKDALSTENAHHGGEVLAATLVNFARTIGDPKLALILVFDGLRLMRLKRGFLTFLTLRDSMSSAIAMRCKSQVEGPERGQFLDDVLKRTFARFGMGNNAEVNVSEDWYVTGVEDRVQGCAFASQQTNQQIAIRGRRITHAWQGHQTNQVFRLGIPIGNLAAFPARRFEVYIVEHHMDGVVAIGLADEQTPVDEIQLPGWYPHSIGYHSDDAKVYLNRPVSRLVVSQTCQAPGTLMGCGIDSGHVVFYRNGIQVFIGPTLAELGQPDPWHLFPSIGIDGGTVEICIPQ